MRPQSHQEVKWHIHFHEVSQPSLTLPPEAPMIMCESFAEVRNSETKQILALVYKWLHGIH